MKTVSNVRKSFFPFHFQKDSNKDFPFLVEELEREHYQRIQLGFKPEAPPPDLANVKPKISTRHDGPRKYVKKPTKGN